jgi:putative heme iron utilization protein
MAPKIDPIRPTDAEAIRLAKQLVRSARFGALAVIDPATGMPSVSRVATATDIDGSPIILVSDLTPHTASMTADPRVSLLLGEPGKGDPLAHPRITLFCQAARIGRDSNDHARIVRRYLNRHPKAKLYAGFGDFHFFRFTMTGASLNGGFGKAYRLKQIELESTSPANHDLAETEQSAINHMNKDHADAVRSIAAGVAKKAGDEWFLTGIDSDGIDLACGDKTRRIFFSNSLNDIRELKSHLSKLLKSTEK